MKKFLFLIALPLLIATASHAQLAANQGYLVKPGVHLTQPPTDTVTNIQTLNQVISIPGYHDVISFQPTITKTSGTAAGTVALYVSLDGVSYVPAPITVQSFNLTDVATQSFLFQVIPSGFPFYQLRTSGTGAAEVLKVKSLYTYRDKPLR